jgi:hypothetical protein
MLTPADFEIGTIVSFNLYPAAILGTGYTNAKVLAILDSGTAAVLGYDVAARHANVFSTLPSGVPNDFTAYSYLKLLLATGDTTVIGIPWIIQSSLVVASVSSIQFTVQNITPSDQNTILQVLSAAGFKAVGMRVVSQT